MQEAVAQTSVGKEIDFPLYLITDRRQTSGRPLLDVVHAALDGGVMAVQLREKDLGSRELYKLAKEMRSLTGQYGAKLFINDRIDVALAAGADGVHLGAGSIPVSEERRVWGTELLIGYSAHSSDEASQAADAGADFLTIGPVYHTPSKAAYGKPLGLSELHATVARSSIPVFALGGVKQSCIADVMSAGASGIALISAILTAEDPKKETVSLLKTIEEHVTNFC
jgi:thiamine-phosphate pyrophosphorylase